MFISDAYAQAAGATQPGAEYWVMQLAPLLLIFAVFYFLIIRPQQKRLKAHRDMLAALQRGDTVVTSGGLIGKVRSIADDELRVELAPNVEVRVVRGAVTDVRNKAAPPPANDSKPAKAE